MTYNHKNILNQGPGTSEEGIQSLQEWMREAGMEKSFSLKMTRILTKRSALVRILSVVIYRNPTEISLSKKMNVLVLITRRSGGWRMVGNLWLQVWLGSGVYSMVRALSLVFRQLPPLTYWTITATGIPRPSQNLLSLAISME